MTRICWRLVDIVCRTFEPDEQAAVLGDLAESGETALQALGGVLGLFARRQAALWTSWKPWLALLGIALPSGILLSLVSRSVADGTAIPIWMYVNNWTWTYVTNAAFRLDLLHYSAIISIQYLTLACCSWTSGFALGALSRRAIPANGAMFCLMLLIGTLSAPRFRGQDNAAVFSLMFYDVIFPLIIQTVLVLLPALRGMRQGLRLASLPLPLQTLLCAFAIASMAVQVMPRWSPMRAPVLQTTLAIGAPLVYMVANNRRRFRNISSPLILGFTAFIASSPTALSQNSPNDYPQWRGKTRDGSASAFAEPKSWPDKLTQRWKVEVGEGYATPIVIGNIVYTFTRRESDEMIIALDAMSGKMKWQTRYPAPYQVSSPARAHGAGPKATPLFHRDKLYTLGISGIVTAFDVSSGKLLWQTAAPKEQPYYGSATSPLGHQDLIIIHPGNYGPLTAFEADTGKVRWAAAGDGAYASPIIARIAGQSQIVATTQKSVAGISLEDGSTLWQHPWAPDMPVITPVLYGETILVSGHNAGVAAIKITRQEGKWTTGVAWETKDVSMFMSNPVLVHDTLFGLSHKASGQFFALDAKTGRVHWLGPPREAANSAIVKAGNLLFLLNDDAELIVARSSIAGFEPIKRYTVADSATWAQPAIAGDRVFIKDVSSLALWTLR